MLIYPIPNTPLIELMIFISPNNFLLAGGVNVQVDESTTDDFLRKFGAKNLMKDFPCCIDLVLTNGSNSFQYTKTVSIGLSHFHKIMVTVLKTMFPTVNPKVLLYGNY